MPLCWASFNLVAQRIQNGGWARQVASDSFAIANTIAGVNMRLGRRHPRDALAPVCGVGGRDRRHLPNHHYRRAGTSTVADVKEGDLWYFPAGLPHSLQGLDPDGSEFVIGFDDGECPEFNTLLVSDWLTHTPPEVWPRTSGCRKRRSRTSRCATCTSTRATRRPAAGGGRSRDERRRQARRHTRSSSR